MNTDQLLYLIDIAKTGSINTTAKRMFSSQQAISEAIKRLESELNCLILERSKKGVTLTDDGKFVLQHGMAMMNHYQLMQEHFNSNPATLRGHLDIGVAWFAISTILSDLILKMHRLYPHVALYTTELTVEDILEQLLQGELDFGIAGFSAQGEIILEDVQKQYQSVLCFEKLYVDHLVCVIYKNNPLAINQEIHSTQLDHIKYTRYTYPRFDAEEPCLHCSNHTEIHKKFMQEENTVCLMPYQGYKVAYGEKDFRALRVVDASPVNTCLIYRRQDGSATDALYQTFIKTVVEFTQLLSQ